MVTDRTPKLTIPSFNMIYARGGREAIDPDHDLPMRAFPGTGELAPLLPPLTEQTAPFFDALGEGRLVLQRCHVRQEVIDELGPGFAALVGLDADVIANTIVFAIAQPPNVSFSEILVRPTASAM
jgi:hypothetical protein